MPVTQVGLRPVPVIRDGDGPGVLVNRDLTNSVLVGTDSSIVGDNINSVSILDALVGIPYDGTQDIYACTITATPVAVDYIQGGQNWNPSPAQSAQQIAALGLSLEATQQVVKGNTLATATNVASLPTSGLSTDAHLTAVTTPLAQTTDIKALHATGQTVAVEVSNTGVPLLTNSLLVKNQGAISQSPGVVSQSATFGITQIGYEILLTIYATGNFSSFYHIGLSWFDSGTGVQTAQEDYWFVPGTAVGTPHTIIGRGPTKGNQLVITSEVPSASSVSVTHLYTVFQNSRVYTSDRWRTLVFNVAGVTATDATPGTNLIASTNTSVNAGATLTRVLPFYHGTAKVYVSTTSGLADGRLEVTQIADWTGGSLPLNADTANFKTDSNGLIYAEVNLPKSQCELALTNSNAAAKTFGVTMVANELMVN